ncbi:hypothetical protein OB955_01950 [Halobacteria archaeon AArc-m2/3/4]|uniref:Uncharacterized protein n=1 Tax=Natronoglomus mannanivorans TaxID=2979990 RepID=A0AAP3E0E2_9EURY|nr:hypothetical protein [Halobacteria archaeon AArc-xg1-1]MCU4971505.1 hypothetical protein [Halobacteria archaeon AArc-m2/3/4]
MNGNTGPIALSSLGFVLITGSLGLASIPWTPIWVGIGVTYVVAAAGILSIGALDIEPRFVPTAGTVVVIVSGSSGAYAQVVTSVRPMSFLGPTWIDLIFDHHVLIPFVAAIVFCFAFARTTGDRALLAFVLCVPFVVFAIAVWGAPFGPGIVLTIVPRFFFAGILAGLPLYLVGRQL